MTLVLSVIFLTHRKEGYILVDLNAQEMEILAVLAINAVESGELAPGIGIHPTLVDRLESAHSKLIVALEKSRGEVWTPDSA